MIDKRGTQVHGDKTQTWAGATPLFRSVGRTVSARSSGSLPPWLQAAIAFLQLREVQAKETTTREEKKANAKKSPETEPRKAVTVRTQQSVNISLHQYAEFLGCSLDRVVVEALKLGLQERH